MCHVSFIFFKSLNNLVSYNFDRLQVQEGDSVHMECRITPINDPKLTVQWFVQTTTINIFLFRNVLF